MKTLIIIMMIIHAAVLLAESIFLVIGIIKRPDPIFIMIACAAYTAIGLLQLHIVRGLVYQIKVLDI